MITLEEINKAVSNLDKMTQTNATLADDNLLIVRSMSTQGQKLIDAIEFFKNSTKPQQPNEINLYNNFG